MIEIVIQFTAIMLLALFRKVIVTNNIYFLFILSSQTPHSQNYLIYLKMLLDLELK